MQALVIKLYKAINHVFCQILVNKTYLLKLSQCVDVQIYIYGDSLISKVYGNSLLFL